jgi:hypothetical protein
MKNQFRIGLITLVLLLGLWNIGQAQSVLQASKDSYVRGGTYADNNYGTATDLDVKIGDNESYMRKALFQFDLSTLSNVNQAVLRLYVNSAKTATLTAYLVADDWDETSVSWNTLPTIESSVFSTDIDAEGLYYEIIVTDLVQTEFAGDKKLSLLFTDDGISNNTVTFNSKEASAYPPQLVVVEESYDNFSRITASDDAKIYYWGSSKHTKNYGSDAEIAIAFNGNVSSSYDSYLKFDISSVTEPIDTVLLQLYTIEMSRASSISIYGINDDESWDESSITGYEKPLATERIGTYAINGLGIITFDIANYFNKAILNNKQILTLVLKENEGASFTFNSSEASENKPQLLIGTETTTYQEPTTTGGALYFDSENGDDSNLGTSEAEPWQNLSKLSDLTLEAGSQILLKRGSVWNRQQIMFKGSGAENSPISIGAYGAGNKPQLNGAGISNGVILLFNQEYIEISDLEITNMGSTRDSLRRGIYILADNFGAVHGIKITDMYFNNINGTDGYVEGVYANDDDEKRSGGVYMEIRGDDVKTYFDDFLLESCYFYNVSNTGFSNTSHWSDLNIDSDWVDNVEPGTSNSDYVHNFVPSTNMVFRKNRFERILSQGLIVRTAANPLMEYNLFYYCSTSEGSDNACFNSKTTDAVWRFNESCYTQYTDGQGDGAGIDSDLRVKRTIIEFNYCHDNGYGGVIATGGRFIDSFNDSTIIRYNIFANNGHNTVRLCNHNTNAIIFNNLIYYDKDSDVNRLVFQHIHSDSYYGPSNTFVNNNIFYTKNNNGIFSADQDSSDERVEECNYSHNLYYGIQEAYQYPDDSNKVTADPLFVSDTMPDQEIGGYVVLGDDGLPTGEINYQFLTGFKLQSTSPAIDMGLVANELLMPAFDFENIAFQISPTVLNIGPFETDSTLVVGLAEEDVENSNMKVYPTLATDYINLDVKGTANDVLHLQIVDTKGAILYASESVMVSETQKFKVNLNAIQIKNGIYFIRVIQNNERSSIQKFIKY